MKPFILHLPDALRDNLEDCLRQRHAGKEPSDGRQISEHVAALLFPTRPHSYGDFPVALGNAIGGLTTASGHQAILLENLPRHHSEVFIRAFMQILHGDLRSTPDTMIPAMRPSGRFDGIGFHQDSTYTPSQPTKMLRSLLCTRVGSTPDPTLFLTADEVIHAIACERVGLAIDIEHIPSNQQASFIAARDAVIAELKSVHAWTHDPFDNQADPEYQPFLQENPNYMPNTGAPEFFICATAHDRKLMATPQGPHAAFYAMTERLRELCRADGIASIRENTAVIWNDAGVLHDRAGAPQHDRELLTTGARPRTFSERFDPAQRLASAPVCRLG